MKHIKCDFVIKKKKIIVNSWYKQGDWPEALTKDIHEIISEVSTQETS